MKSTLTKISSILLASGFAASCGASGSGNASTPGGDGGAQDGTTPIDGSGSSSGSDSGSSGSMDSAIDVAAADVAAGDSGPAEGGGMESGSGEAGADAAAGCGGATGWPLVWSDEFNGPDGSAIDSTRWTALTGGDGWGNQEREYYTSDLANAQQSGGNLVITATTAGASAHSCWYGQCLYTSARLQTLGFFSQAYGRFEARIKVPSGQGLWPAFWMLGANINSVGWPSCGEIDVMENIGKEPGIVHGSMHGPGYSGGSALTASYTLPGGVAYASDFHLFAVEWETGVARFYVDDVLYETQTPASIPAGDTWVFDQPFFMLLDVAVGGGFPGDPDATTVFPQTMLVDYLRVCSP